jgi:CheY-like chemotaxis protein
MTESQPIVVIADDDKNNVLALEKVFQREGFRVIPAAGGAEALASISSTRSRPPSPRWRSC